MRRAALTLAFALICAPALADDNSDANRLFVEAALMLEELPEGLAAAAALHADVLGNLERILTEHPGSDLAVRLVSGEEIGPISLIGARARSADAQAALAAGGGDCAAQPTAQCLRDLAARELLAVPEGRERAELGGFLAADPSQLAAIREGMMRQIARALPEAAAPEAAGLLAAITDPGELRMAQLAVALVRQEAGEIAAADELIAAALSGLEQGPLDTGRNSASEVFAKVTALYAARGDLAAATELAMAAGDAMGRATGLLIVLAFADSPDR